MTNREREIWNELDSLYSQQARLAQSHHIEAGTIVPVANMEAWIERRVRMRTLEDELWRLVGGKVQAGKSALSTPTSWAQSC
jgi:hypothetical protein